MFQAIECILSFAEAKEHFAGFLGGKEAGMGRFAPNPSNSPQITKKFTKSEILI